MSIGGASIFHYLEVWRDVNKRKSSLSCCPKCLLPALSRGWWKKKTKKSLLSPLCLSERKTRRAIFFLPFSFARSSSLFPTSPLHSFMMLCLAYILSQQEVLKSEREKEKGPRTGEKHSLSLCLFFLLAMDKRDSACIHGDTPVEIGKASSLLPASCYCPWRLMLPCYEMTYLFNLLMEKQRRLCSSTSRACKQGIQKKHST